MALKSLAVIERVRGFALSLLRRKQTGCEENRQQQSEGELSGRKGKRSCQSTKKSKWTLDSFPVAEKEGYTRFHEFPVALKVMRAIADLGFQYCTPVQEQALADCLAGVDLVAEANTGTGKTAVFLITIITQLLQGKRRKPGQVRALVLAPTRELVIQIGKDARHLAKYSNLSICTVFGGIDYHKQQKILQEKSCDILVATPGRLLDFLGKNIVRLDFCQILVLDEADRMLDMGFIPDVRRIVGRLPKTEKRQTMLFSATVTEKVRHLASQWCLSPRIVKAEPEKITTEKIKQRVYLASAEEKCVVLYNLIKSRPDERIIVFTNMKGEARRLSDWLQKNSINCALLSGDVSQQKRMRRLERFRTGKVNVLVATDVAGRGIHIDDIQVVVNFTLPYEPEDYVHRIGRTGRAGAGGLAVSFACEEGAFYLPAIEEMLGESFDCVFPEKKLLSPVAPAEEKERQYQPKESLSGASPNTKRSHRHHRVPKGRQKRAGKQ